MTITISYFFLGGPRNPRFAVGGVEGKGKGGIDGRGREERERES